MKCNERTKEEGIEKKSGYNKTCLQISNANAPVEEEGEGEMSSPGILDVCVCVFGGGRIRTPTRIRGMVKVTSNPKEGAEAGRRKGSFGE